MNEYDDLADLDDVFGPLRNSARPAELSQERAVVDLMVKAHRTAEGKHMFTSRRARIATLVAAGVLGFGGMAAASPNLLEFRAAEEPATEEPVIEPVTEEPAVEEPITEVQPVVEEPTVDEEVVEEESVEPEPVEAQVAEGEPIEITPTELDDDPNTKFVETSCVEGNHGKTVSAVARGDSDFLDQYKLDNPDEDVPTVVDAAHSSCGKTDRDEETESDVDEPEVEKSEVEETEEPKAKVERPGKSADGPGNGKSNGVGKSNGNGNGKRGG